MSLRRKPSVRDALHSLREKANKLVKPKSSTRCPKKKSAQEPETDHKAHEEYLAEQEELRQAERYDRMESAKMKYHIVKNTEQEDLTESFLEAHNIKVETLSVAGDNDAGSTTPAFFAPLPQEEMRKHRYAKDKQSKVELKKRNRALEGLTDSGESGTAHTLCFDLTWRATEAKRVHVVRDGETTIKTKEPPLSERLGWQWKRGFNQGMLHDEYYEDIFESTKFRPIHSWESTSPDKRPHLMLTLKHGAPVDDNLLRGELLTILGVTESRMPWTVFKDNLIFPIMVFSFIGARGRIIQAHHDGTNIVIQKTKLFEFFHKTTAVSNMEIFVRYLASKPGGNTVQRLGGVLSSGVPSTPTSPTAESSRHGGTRGRLHRTLSHLSRLSLPFQNLDINARTPSPEDRRAYRRNPIPPFGESSGTRREEDKENLRQESG